MPGRITQPIHEHQPPNNNNNYKEKFKMNATKRFIAGGVISASMLTGGVIGAIVMGPLSASAATSTTATTAAAAATPVATAATAAPATKTFTPNEDATHEAGESAAREAQEDAGQMPTIP